MRKLFVFLIMALLVFVTFGCNTVNPPKPPETGRHIKLYVTEGGGPVAASKIVLDGQSVEITPGQSIYLFQYQTPGLKACLYVDGVPQTDQIDISEVTDGPGESHCFYLNNMGVAPDGYGTVFDTKWDGVGKSRVKATLGEESIYCTVFTFDCVPNLGYNNGMRLEGLGSKYLSNVRTDCFIWLDSNPSVMAYVIPGKSYIAANSSDETWRQDMYGVTSVNLEALDAGMINRKLSSYQNKIIVTENPYIPGTYIKLVQPGPNFGYPAVFDFSETTEFRQ